MRTIKIGLYVALCVFCVLLGFGYVMVKAQSPAERERAHFLSVCNDSNGFQAQLHGLLPNGESIADYCDWLYRQPEEQRVAGEGK